MCSFLLIAFNILLIADIMHAYSEEPWVPKYLEERMFEKIIEINLNVQRALDRLDKIDKTKEQENCNIHTIKEQHRSDISRLLNSGHQTLLVEDLEKYGWEMIFRATSSNGQNVFKAWTTGVNTSPDKPTSMARSYSSHYRNSFVTNWANIGAKYVKYAFYKNNQEVAYVIFNATGSDVNSWFDKSRILSSSYTDLTSLNVYNYFSIAGSYAAGNYERRFFINKAYGGCDVDIGHMVISEEIPPSKGCSWDNHPKYPQFLYSTINSVDVWSRGLFGRADYMAIFVKS